MEKIKSKLLQEAKELNIPHWSYIKRKQELRRAIDKTQCTYYDIVFGYDTPRCRKCLDELKNQKVTDERVHN